MSDAREQDVRWWVPAAVGGGVGVLSSLWFLRSAKAAVAVRPALADAGPVDAFFANHTLDWLFYHEPLVGTLWVVLAGALFGHAAGGLFR